MKFFESACFKRIAYYIAFEFTEVELSQIWQTADLLGSLVAYVVAVEIEHAQLRELSEMGGSSGS